MKRKESINIISFSIIIFAIAFLERDICENSLINLFVAFLIFALGVFLVVLNIKDYLIKREN